MIWIVKLPLRVVNAVFAAWWYYMEIWADKCVRFFVKTKYVRKGKCNQCGKCCRLLALVLPKWVANKDFLVRIFNWWHDVVLNFEFQGRDGNWLIYKCRYFVEEGSCRTIDGVKNLSPKGRCKIYPFRHKLCRLYPRQTLYTHPKLHPECGFAFIRRDGKSSFDEVLRSRFTDKIPSN